MCYSIDKWLQQANERGGQLHNIQCWDDGTSEARRASR
jgi:hypothetical protein